MKKEISELIVKIEEYINSFDQKQVSEKRVFSLINLPRRSLSADKAAKHLSRGTINNLDAYLDDMDKGRTQPDFVNEMLPKKGFVRPDGQLNSVKFYTHARISPDVWSTFSSRKHKPREDTMLKIVIGLSMSKAEAEEFLALGGVAFNESDNTHKIILACIHNHIYDPDEVYDILEYYKEHLSGVRNIYAEKKVRKDCK